MEVTVEFDEKEYAEIQSYAQICGIGVPEFIRHCVEDRLDVDLFGNADPEEEDLDSWLLNEFAGPADLRECDPMEDEEGDG